MRTPRSVADRHTRNRPAGSPAWKPHATLALVTIPSMASSSPSCQTPKPSPKSALRSIPATRLAYCGILLRDRGHAVASPNVSPTPRRRATLASLADEMNVSRTTVSNAFNRPDQLSADLRERVLPTAKRLGYAGPDPPARSLRTRKAGAVGLVMAEPLT